MAEKTNNAVQAENTQADAVNQQTAAIDYSKIEEIVDKNVEKKEKAVLQSYFEQQGLNSKEGDILSSIFGNKK